MQMKTIGVPTIMKNMYLCKTFANQLHARVHVIDFPFLICSPTVTQNKQYDVWQFGIFIWITT